MYYDEPLVPNDVVGITWHSSFTRKGYALWRIYTVDWARSIQTICWPLRTLLVFYSVRRCNSLPRTDGLHRNFPRIAYSITSGAEVEVISDVSVPRPYWLSPQILCGLLCWPCLKSYSSMNVQLLCYIPHENQPIKKIGNRYIAIPWHRQSPPRSGLSYFPSGVSLSDALATSLILFLLLSFFSLLPCDWTVSSIIGCLPSTGTIVIPFAGSHSDTTTHTNHLLLFLPCCSFLSSLFFLLITISFWTCWSAVVS